MAAWLGRAVISDGQLVGDEAGPGAPGLQPPAIPAHRHLQLQLPRPAADYPCFHTRFADTRAATSHLFMNTMSEPRDVTL